MIQIFGTYDLPGAVLILPNPEPGNTETLTQIYDLKRTMNNQVYTYIVGNSERRILNYNFINIGRGKLFEATLFFKCFSVASLKLIDHHDIVWRVNLMQSDVTPVITNTARPLDAATLIDSQGTLSLAFKGVQIP